MKKDLVLSLQSYTFRDRTFAETLKTAARLGFRSIESYPGQAIGGGIEGSTDYNSMSVETRAKLKALLASQPVKVVSYGVTGADNPAQWTKLMAFCKDLGIQVIQIEAGKDKAYYDLAEKFANQYGVRVSLHNHTQERGLPPGMAQSLAGRGRMIGAGADIGHWTRAGADAAKGAELLKDKFICFHLIDVAPKSCGFRDLPLGSGIIDVKAVLDTLAAQNRTIFATVEYEHQSATLESEVAACVRYFKAWQKDEVAADNQVGAKNLAALWLDVAKSARPDGWDVPTDMREAQQKAEQTQKMTRLEIDLASVKANRRGANDREDVDAAFLDNSDRKFCQRDWDGKSWVSAALKAPGKPTVYTVSSSNDAPGRDPQEWVLLGSENGSDWFELDRRTNELFFRRRFLKGYEIKAPRTIRFVKLEILKKRGGDNEMQFSCFGLFE